MAWAWVSVAGVVPVAYAVESGEDAGASATALFLDHLGSSLDSSEIASTAPGRPQSGWVSSTLGLLLPLAFTLTICAALTSVVSPRWDEEIGRFQIRCCFLAPEGVYVVAGVAVALAWLSRHAVRGYASGRSAAIILLYAATWIASAWMARRFGLTSKWHSMVHWEWVNYLPVMLRNLLHVTVPVAAIYLATLPWRRLKGVPVYSRIAMVFWIILLGYIIASFVFIQRGILRVE